MSCYGFRGSVSARKSPHPCNVHTQSWAPIYFMTRTGEVAFHISALITGHKEEWKEDVQLHCCWLIALPSHWSGMLGLGQLFSTVMGRWTNKAMCELPSFAGGISTAGNQSGRESSLIFIWNRLNASHMFCFFKYFLQTAKSDMCLSGTDHNL